MKITVKGQITIPQRFREQFGLHPGAEVEFMADADGLCILPLRRGRRKAAPAESWLAKAAGSATTKLSTDQILAITRDED